MNGRVAYLGVAFLLLGAALLASPTFGFETIAADRTTDVSTAGDSTALLAFEQTTESIAGRQDTATAFYLRNNADETLQLSVQNTIAASGDVQIANDGSGTIAPGEATQVVVECNGGGSSGTTTVTTTVTQAVGSTMTIADASSTTTIDYTCSGNSNPGQGFQSVSVSDVSHYTSPGDERQTVQFVLGRGLQSQSTVRIDLSAAHPDGVDYTRTNWNTDVQVLQGAGSISSVSENGVIEYQTGQGNDRDRSGATIELSIGSYLTTTAGGPFQATITRNDRGQSGTANFYVVDDGSSPPPPSAENVGSAVSPGDERQTFTFTPGADFNSGQLRIDLSNAQGNGVDYMADYWPDLQVESGSGSVWYEQSTHEIVYQNGGESAGETIRISIGDYGTDATGGPYTVEFTRTDTSDTYSTDFQIAG